MMTEERRYDEKNEKEMMKHEEKSEGGDMLSSIVWALILIWAGFVFLADNLGWFEQVGMAVDSTWMFGSLEDFASFGVWNLIFLGAGVIILLEIVVRLLVPEFRRHVGGSIIMAAVFIGIGLGGFFSWNYIWPLVLIAVGVNILISGIRRKQ